MISRVAFCPHPPLLVPQVAAEAAALVAPLLDACRTATAHLLRPGGRVAVLGAGERTGEIAGHGSLRGYGVPVDVRLGRGGEASLPLSLTVGAWLLGAAAADATGWAVGPDGTVPALDRDALDADALLVMGDGSARRTEKAPGYLDERAAGYDAGIAAALRAGDPAGLRADAALGTELLAAGVPAWTAAGTLLAGTTWDAELLYDEAPFGVGYLVATWTARG